MHPTATAARPRPAQADVVRCGPREQRQARRSPRGRVDGQVDARRRARPPLRHRVEPRVRPSLHADRPRARSGVDERGVHAHRPHPLLVRGLPRRARARRPLRGHRRVHDGRLPRGVPRPADDGFAELVARAVRPLRRLRARRSVAARRNPRVRRATAHDARAVPRAGVGSGSPWVLVEGSARGAARRPLLRRSMVLLHGGLELGWRSDRTPSRS